MRHKKQHAYRIKTLDELRLAGWCKAGSSDFGHISVFFYKNPQLGLEVWLPEYRDLGDAFIGRPNRDGTVSTDYGGNLPESFVVKEDGE